MNGWKNATQRNHFAHTHTRTEIWIFRPSNGIEYFFFCWMICKTLKKHPFHILWIILCTRKITRNVRVHCTCVAGAGRSGGGIEKRNASNENWPWPFWCISSISLVLPMTFAFPSFRRHSRSTSMGRGWSQNPQCNAAKGEAKEKRKITSETTDKLNVYRFVCVCVCIRGKFACVADWAENRRTRTTLTPQKASSESTHWCAINNKIHNFGVGKHSFGARPLVRSHTHTHTQYALFAYDGSKLSDYLCLKIKYEERTKQKKKKFIRIKVSSNISMREKLFHSNTYHPNFAQIASSWRCCAFSVYNIHWAKGGCGSGNDMAMALATGIWHICCARLT